MSIFIGMGLVVKKFDSEMRKDAKITVILLEVVCIAALAAYLIERLFAVDLGVNDKDALAAGLVATFVGLVYLLYSAVLNALSRAKR